MTTTQLPEWQRLADLALAIGGVDLAALTDMPDRDERLCVEAVGITADLSKQRIDARVLDALVGLGHAVELPARLAALMSGAVVNGTENRPALHSALRFDAEDPDDVAPAPVQRVVTDALTRMLDLAERIRSGAFRGVSGRPVTDVVHIGIGGSHLGPALVLDALAPTSPRPPRIHFLANVDGAVAAKTLRGLDPETTLAVVVSKSFTTLESKLNAATLRSWMLERTRSSDDISRQFIAVTARRDAARAAGIPDENILEIWDWVGGRYSLWSAVGLPIAIHLGADGFRALLAGARAMDRHARLAPLERNLPALIALVGIWNYNFLGAQSHAVLPYANRLRLLPDFLQQLEMESNGKSVRADGTPMDLLTMPVLWGGEETNGQHAFHQFLHQGTRAFSVDFLAVAEPGHRFVEHHDWLLANCLAQSESLLRGRPAASLGADPLAPHRAMPGNRPSTTLVLERLDAHCLGALLALYEHKVYCQGIIWQVNSFDQWGVELGKTIGESVHAAFRGGSRSRLSQPTQHLIDILQRHSPGSTST
jgi:glucose-6-phosphate isomerase